MPLAPGVVELAHQFLLLRVHRGHGLSRCKGRGNDGFDVLELRIAIRALVACDDLRFGLQAVALGLEQAPHDDVADRMAHRLEFVGQYAQALARPAPRGLRVAARTRRHQRKQVGHQGRVLVSCSLAPATAAPCRTRRRQCARGHELVARAFKLLHPGHDGVSRDARSRNDLRHANSTQHLRLGSGKGTSLSFVETPLHEAPALRDR